MAAPAMSKVKAVWSVVRTSSRAPSPEKAWSDMESAKRQFLEELNEISQLPSPEARQEALIACYYNLGVAEAGLGNAKEALSWIRLAEQEQNQLGRTIIPGVSDSRQKLESTIREHE